MLQVQRSCTALAVPLSTAQRQPSRIFCSSGRGIFHSSQHSLGGPCAAQVGTLSTALSPAYPDLAHLRQWHYPQLQVQPWKILRSSGGGNIQIPRSWTNNGICPTVLFLEVLGRRETAESHRGIPLSWKTAAHARWMLHTTAFLCHSLRQKAATSSCSKIGTVAKELFL